MIDLSWLPDDGGTGHMSNSPEVINFWKKVKEITNFKKMTEIGFNAGHSSAIILSVFEDTSITSYDIGQFDVTLSNGKILKKKFKDRFDLLIKDSTRLIPEEINGQDILFIDGGHDYPIVKSDLNLFLNSDIKYVVIDDLQNQGVKKAFGEISYRVREIHRAKYTAVLPSWMRNDSSKKPITVPVILAEKK